MNIKADYNEYSKFIKETLNLELSNYQKMILKALCNGLEIRTPRGIGRSSVINFIDEYLIYKKIDDLLSIETKQSIETKK